MNTFDDGKPEEFLALPKNFNIAIDVTGATNPSGRIIYLHVMLRGQALREFDELQSQNSGSTNNHLKLIQEVLLEYFTPINSISKQKHTMRRTMRKPRSINFKRFAARLMEISNFLLLSPGLDVSKKITHEELNEILLHAVPNAWAKQSYLRGWYFEMKTYKETCTLFEIMEISEQVY